MGLWGDGQLSAGEKKPVWLTPTQRKNCFATERGWELLDPSRGAEATGTITLSSTVTTDTLTIEGRTYQFLDTTLAADDVNVGVDDTESAAFLAAAINANGVGDGSDYHAGTVINGSVSAISNGAVVTVTSRIKGISGNEIELSQTGGTMTLSGAKLTGGANGSEVLVSIGGLASRLGLNVGGSFLPAAVNTTGNTVTVPIHGLSVDDRVEIVVDSADTIPAGLAENTNYWVEAVVGLSTLTTSADFVTGNSVSLDVNGTTITQAFDTDNDTTLAAIATTIQARSDVTTATVTDAGVNDREIVITAVSNLAPIVITNFVVTGGASQPTATFVNADTISFALTQGGSAVNITNTGTDVSGLGFQVVRGGMGASQVQDIIILPSTAVTLTTSADFVASNDINFSVNGTPATLVEYSTDNDTTLGLVATEIASHPDVATAVVTDTGGASDREIVIVPFDRNVPIDIRDFVVTAGASQPTATFAKMPSTKYVEGDRITARVGFSEQVIYTPDTGGADLTLQISFDGTDATKNVNALAVSPLNLATSYIDFDYTVTAPGVHAFSKLTFTDRPDSGSTIELGAETYTILDTPVGADDVQRGADQAETVANIIAAINGTGTDGVEYHSLSGSQAGILTAANDGSDNIDVTAVKSGTAPNSLTTTDTTDVGTDMSWADTTLGGGTGASVAGTAGDDAAATELTISAGLVLNGDATITGIVESTGLTDSVDAIVDLNKGGSDENTDIEAAFNAATTTGGGAIITVNQ